MNIIHRILLMAGVPFLAQGYIDKERLDIRQPAAKTTAWPQQGRIGNGVAQATLLEGGFFTLGTEQGLSDQNIDDDNTLTFGHPYAKTSYPLVQVDGKWSKPGEAAGAKLKGTHQSRTELALEYELPGGLTYRFSLHLDSAGLARQKIVLRAEFSNASPAEVEVRAGLVLDPGLGVSGQDAWAIADGETLVREASLSPSTLELWERGAGNKGVGYSLTWTGVAPQAVQAGNWQKIAGTDGESFNLASPALLYDLALKFLFPAAKVEPGGRTAVQLEAILLTPDPGKAFLRWDCPRSISTATGRILPQDFPSTVRIYNAGTSSADMTVRLNLPYEMEADTPAYASTVPAGRWSFRTQTLHVRENYQGDAFLPVSAVAMQGQQVVDSLGFVFFQPMSPFSNEGLEVSIDSSFPGPAGQANLLFHVKKTATGQALFDLGRENVVLKVNGTKVEDFTLGKDTTGGSALLDIVFILDVTGSMGDEIAGVKNNIIEFGNSLSEKGIDFRLGMVTFLDAIETIFPMTADVHAFRDKVGEQFAHGGGDSPENSLDALAAGAQMQFRDRAKVMFIWITDAEYHQGNSISSRTAASVSETLVQRDIQVHCIGTESLESQYYQAIYQPTGGEFYNINGNFQDILLDIAGTRFSRNMLLSFKPPSEGMVGTVHLEVHRDGLGGADTLDWGPAPAPKSATSQASLNIACAGVPCNLAHALGSASPGTLQIFDARGMRLMTLDFDGKSRKGPELNALPVAAWGAGGPGLLFFTFRERSSGSPSSPPVSMKRGRILFMNRK